MLETKENKELVVDPENLYINTSDEYILSQVVKEVMLDMDEEELHHFLVFGLTFFLGWLVSGFFY